MFSLYNDFEILEVGAQLGDLVIVKLLGRFQTLSWFPPRSELMFHVGDSAQSLRVPHLFHEEAGSHVYKHSIGVGQLAADVERVCQGDEDAV